MLRNPEDATGRLGVFSAGRLAGLTGSSSSSLAVRSITWDAGRLLVDWRTAEEVDEGSRDCRGVCCKGKSIETGSCFTGVRAGVIPGSFISINSSSSSVGGVAPLVFVASSSLGLDHSPSGSMITCSVSAGVERRISSTYLHGQQSLNGNGGSSTH